MLPKVGAKVKIVDFTSGHGFPIGLMVKVRSVNKNNQHITAADEAGRQYTLYKNDYQYNLSKEDLELSIVELDDKKSEIDNEISKIRSQIEYLEKTGKTEVLPMEFEAYYTLQILKDSNLSDTEKAFEFAKLLS